MYIHQQPDWPHLYWRTEDIAVQLADVRYLQGHLLGRMEGVGFELRQAVTLALTGRGSGQDQ